MRINAVHRLKTLHVNLKLRFSRIYNFLLLLLLSVRSINIYQENVKNAVTRREEKISKRYLQNI